MLNPRHESNKNIYSSPQPYFFSAMDVVEEVVSDWEDLPEAKTWIPNSTNFNYTRPVTVRLREGCQS
jgi:hypothetical protein